MGSRHLSARSEPTALSWALPMLCIGAPDLGIRVQSRPDIPYSDLGQGITSTHPLTTSVFSPHLVADSGTQ